MSQSRPRPLFELCVFFTLAFAIAWGGFALLIFQGPLMTRLFGPFGYTSPLFFLIVCSPSLAAIVLSAIFGGWRSVGSMLAALFRRASLAWWLLAVLALPAASLLVGSILQLAGGPSVNLNAYLVAWPALLFTTPYLLSDPGPVGEEFGWRGFAQPRMLACCGILPAGAVLGLVWGVWHLPVFFTPGMTNHATVPIPMFIACSVAASVFFTWLYVRANKNLLLSGIIPHYVMNSIAITGAVQFGGPTMLAASLALGAALLLMDLARGKTNDWFYIRIRVPEASPIV